MRVSMYHSFGLSYSKPPIKYSLWSVGTFPCYWQSMIIYILLVVRH